MSKTQGETLDVTSVHEGRKVGREEGRERGGGTVKNSRAYCKCMGGIGNGVRRRTRKRGDVCVCACVCGNLISGWTVHTAPAYTVLKNLPKVPRAALPGSLGNSLLQLAPEQGWILSV